MILNISLCVDLQMLADSIFVNLLIPKMMLKKIAKTCLVEQNSMSYCVISLL